MPALPCLTDRGVVGRVNLVSQPPFGAETPWRSTTREGHSRSLRSSTTWARRRPGTPPGPRRWASRGTGASRPCPAPAGAPSSSPPASVAPQNPPRVLNGPPPPPPRPPPPLSTPPPPPPPPPLPPLPYWG